MRSATHPTPAGPRRAPRSLTLALVLAMAIALPGCQEQSSEDVAALRALMEQQEAEKKAAQERDRQLMEEMKRKAKESGDRLRNGQ